MAKLPWAVFGVLAVLCLLASATGCRTASSSDDAGNGDASLDQARLDRYSADQRVDTTVALETLLAARFIVGRGTFEAVNGPECCQTSCGGNNPATPYLGFWAPPAPGQTAKTTHQRDNGSSWYLRLRGDEALLYVGKTPAQSRYFGFTPYLWEKGPHGFPVVASLSETLNNKVIATDAPKGAAPFERRTAVIATADAATLAAVTEALTASGFPAGAINSLVFDPALSTFGLGAESDTFGVMFRAALFADAAKKDAYFARPPGVVYRLTPRTTGSFKPLPSPVARPKGTATEQALASAVDRLGLAIRAKHSNYTAERLTVIPNNLDPARCISYLTVCLADNRDTIYPEAVLPHLFTAGRDEFYIAFGVNHERTAKSTYSNVAVYSVEKQFGVKNVTSDKYEGSAKKYLPADPEADKLYAYKIARSCSSGGGVEPYCLEIPRGSCPSGIDDGKAGAITFRAYLEPSTNTAPDRDTLVIDRILYFRR